MRRFLLLGVPLLVPGLLAGCTGTGLFFDHTFQFLGHNPNAPAGNSQTMMRIRGEQVAITPILPETGNVWPGAQAPDPTLDELSRQQTTDAQRAAGQGLPATQPRTGRSPASLNLPPGLASPQGPVVQTPNGPSVDVGRGGGERGYRQLQSPSPGGTGILVPNGNGTSTLIGPDGSIQTVPTRQ